jgi:molecular chaperone DnaK (HSP70)
VKGVLSANKEVTAMIEGLVGDFDLSVYISRSTFEDLSANIFERLEKLALEVVKKAGLTIVPFRIDRRTYIFHRIRFLILKY